MLDPELSACAMALTILMLFASACAPRNPGLVPVQTVLQGRIDVLPRLTSTVSDDRVRLLLSQPLDADDAVEIALLNNADLQAEFEGLNIAYAALRDASLLPNLELETDVASIQGSSENEFGFALTANLSQLFLTSMRRDVARYELDATQYETAVTVLVGLVASWMLYSLNIFEVGYYFLPFLVSLIVFGWCLGFTASLH